MANYQTKQEQSVKIGVYLYNGGFRAFEGYPIDLECWNLQARSEIEFMGGKTIATALDGYEYSNADGYRLYVSATLDSLYKLTEKLSWKSIFNLLSGQYDKTFATLVTSGTGSSDPIITFTSAASAVDDFYNGLQISAGLSSGNGVIITDYVGATRQATLQSTASWSNGVNLTITAQPNLQRVIGLSLTGETADILYYNIDGNALGVNRDFTIGNQILNMKFRSVDRYSEIPQSFVLNG
jgi:hypothetical protein